METGKQLQNGVKFIRRGKYKFAAGHAFSERVPIWCKCIQKFKLNTVSQNNPKAELVSPGTVIFCFRFLEWFDSFHTGPCKINGSYCGRHYSFFFPLADLSTSVTTGLCIYIFLLPGVSLTPNYRRFSTALCISALCFSALLSSTHWKTARRKTFTQWWGHLLKWADFHHFLCNPHFELALNFFDQL